MDQFNNILSTLSVGQRIRITQTDGQSWEGTVVQNDKAEFLQLQVNMTTLVRYRAIDSLIVMDTAQGQAVPVSTAVLTTAAVPNTSTQTTVTTEAVPSKKDFDPEKLPVIQTLPSKNSLSSQEMTDDGLQELAGQLNDNDKGLLGSTIEILLKDYAATGAEDKLSVDAEQLAALARGDQISDKKLACQIAAAGFYLAGKYEQAVETLYFNDLIREAYLTAFTADFYAEKDDLKFHRLAGGLAVLYLLYGASSAYYAEAAACLRETSFHCKDVSGVEFLEQNQKTELQKAYCYEVIKRVADKAKMVLPSDKTLHEMIVFLKEKYPNGAMAATILKLEQDKINYHKDQQVQTGITQGKDGALHDTLGNITKLNSFESKGIIVGFSGNQYEFEFSSIKDKAFQKKIRSMAGNSGGKKLSIPVKFSVEISYSKPFAIDIVPNMQKGEPPKPFSETSPNALFTAGKMEAALAGYKQWMLDGKTEDGFCGCVQCYLSLLNQSPDLRDKYLPELQDLVEGPKVKLNVTVKAYTSLYNAYTKLGWTDRAIETLDKMLASDIFKDASTRFHHMNLKAGALRKKGDLKGAIEALVELERYVDKERLYEKKSHLQMNTYTEMAEMYIELGNYQDAQYYLEMSDNIVKRKELLEKIHTLRQAEMARKLYEQEGISGLMDNGTADNTEGTPSDSTAMTPEEDRESSDNTDAVQEEAENAVSSESDEEEEAAEEADSEDNVEYTDEEAFDKLIVSDKDVFDTAFSFSGHQLECLLAYLMAAAQICQNTVSDRTSVLMDIPVTDAIINVSELVNAAFAVHGSHETLSCDRLMLNYRNACELIPAYSGTLFVSAALRSMFSDKTLQSYEIERVGLMDELEKITPEAYRNNVTELAQLLYSFKANTGYNMDMFADYNSGNEVIQSIVDNAQGYRKGIDEKVKTPEKHVRFRYTRELVLHDKNSIIASGLDIVCDNDTRQCGKLRSSIKETFMGSGDEVSVERIDVKKLDQFIDEKWDLARDILNSEKNYKENFYDRLKGSRRNNLISTLKRVIDCICQWINTCQEAAVPKEGYFLEQYTSRKEKVLDNLRQLIQKTQTSLQERFDWGVYSICQTAVQLQAKMDGTYKTSSERYQFINFLRTNHILLDENCMPELSSTFSDLDEFNIFARIKAYAAETPVSWQERIQQIFSNNLHNNNFRSAVLIRSYGEAIGDKGISEHPLYENLEACIKSAHKRTVYSYQEFRNELELDESRGCLSDTAGYKTFVSHNIEAWYSAAVVSNDFGFLSDLMDIYRQKISDNAATIAVRLMKQLRDLAGDPSYDFGIYSAQQIEDYIKDNNFTVAENILNCIRRHDTRTITDFTQEPKSYFDSFMSEYDLLYRAVADTKITLQKSLMNYYGTVGRQRSIEAILRRVTNNINKDVRGGIALINHWPVKNPAGVDTITKFISLLGFTDITVTKSNAYGKDDVYQIRRAKKTGKITYPHPIPAFGSLSVEEGLRVLVLYGRYDTDRMIDKFHEINTVSQNTIVILDSILNQEERRRLARKIKKEKAFARSFIVIDRVLLFYLAKHYQSNTISRMLMATTMPFAYNQPYCPQPNTPLPGELFTGRTEELRLIEEYDGVNLVYGGRQLGKSSLLQRAALNIDKNDKGDRAIVIGIKDRNYTDAARIVSQKLILADILPEGSECDDWDTLTMHIEKRLKDDSENRINYLLLMLDEADEFIGSCREVRYRPITNLKNLNSNRFKFVLAGLHNLSKYNYEAVFSNNSDIAHLSSVVIRPFRRPEATELLTHALAYLGFVFSDDVINLILAQTNYFPGLIHLYAQKLIAALTNEDYAGYSESETPYYHVTDSHIKKVLTDQSFKDEIRNKLRMTLEIQGKKNSPYYIIALLLAYLYYEEEGTAAEFTVDDIISKAGSYEINALLQYTREQITELMHEMWDLNILTAKGDYYMFSTEGFRELLGNKEEVNSELSAYMGGGEDEN